MKSSSTGGKGHGRQRLTPRDALARAFMVWLASLVIAGGALGTAFGVAAAGEPLVLPERPIDLSLIVSGIVTVLGIVVPNAVYWRLMHTAWRGGVVEPRGYLRATAILYGGYTLTVVALSVIALVRAEAWMFELMAGYLPMILLLLAWPTGHVMYEPHSRDEEDSADTLHMEDEDEG